MSASGRRKAVALWALFLAVILAPIVATAFSPLLAWRSTVYILAGFAGVVGLALLLAQPLLMGGYLPGLSGYRGRRVHRWTGFALVVMIVAHVGGLWITSPPDVIDALLFVSPTPFSDWGVVAMLAVFGAAALALLRRRMRLRVWRVGHTLLVVTAVIGTVGHAVQIDGAMEPVTRALLCIAVLAGTAKVVLDRRAWSRRNTPR